MMKRFGREVRGVIASLWWASPFFFVF